MASGHAHGHTIRAEEKSTILRMMGSVKFKAALAQYTRTDESHFIPYLAGSDNAGRVIFYDRRLPPRIRVKLKAGSFRYVDPRKFLRWHEAVEGVLIRRYGLDYAKAHRFATAVERMRVEEAGIKFASYQRALEPSIRKDEHDRRHGLPENLLAEAYRGSRFYRLLKPVPEARKPYAKAQVGYAKGHPGSRCGLCAHYLIGACEIVKGEIAPDMWCEKFKKVSDGRAERKAA